jgi:hypothetical protein
MHRLDSAAEWFLRLNGFFTVLNFVVHPFEPGEGTQQRTDADVLGVRFPQRQEIVGGRRLPDHEAFRDAPSPLFIIAEVKAGCCRLNGPWTRPKDRNVTHVLRSFGGFAPETLNAVSDSLYRDGRYQSEDLAARLLCFGASTSPHLKEHVLQFTWDQVFGFVYDRYQVFWRVKRQNQQWPPIGRFLWDRCRDQQRSAYVQAMLTEFSVAAL